MGSSPVKKIETALRPLSSKLHTLLRKNNLNANQVAQELGIPMMTIRRIILGETTDPRISTLKLIADHFNVSIDSLVEEGTSSTAVPLNQTRPIFIPILDWSLLEKIESIHDMDLSKWENWHPVSLNNKTNLGRNAFALESRRSMYPRFPHGTIFIFDPDVSPTDGDIVLVKMKSNNELTLRELFIDPPEWQLHSITSSSRVFQYKEDECKIVGINMLTMLYNRREHD